MKPILVGLNNPYSADPVHALAPYPERSAGHRLWKMLGDVDSSRLSALAFNASAYSHIYRDYFDRRNLFGARVPAAPALREVAAEKLVRGVPRGATVILLGAEVRACVGNVLSDKIKPILIHPQVIDGVTWRCLPHPSGRSTLYNDPVVRMLAGMVLADCLTKETQGCHAAESARR